MEDLTTQEKAELFKAELKALLEKYSATITCSYYGEEVQDEQMEVTFHNDKRSWEGEDIKICDGACIEEADL